jgi:hypothetical protein
MDAVGMRKSKVTHDPALYMYQATKAYRGRRGKPPRFVNSESRWRWLVISKFRPLYLRGREHWIGSRSERSDKRLFAHTQNIGCPEHRLISVEEWTSDNCTRNSLYLEQAILTSL